jgi:hypothetical protein
MNNGLRVLVAKKTKVCIVDGCKGPAVYKPMVKTGKKFQERILCMKCCKEYLAEHNSLSNVRLSLRGIKAKL